MVSVALGAAGLVTVVTAGPARAASGDCVTSGTLVTCTFTETGSAQTWTVPPGINQETFTLYGAQGGAAATVFQSGLSLEFNNGSGTGGVGGLGAEVTAALSISSGTVLQVNVGQAGTSSGIAFGGGAAPVLGFPPVTMVQVTVKVGGVSSQATAAGLFTYGPLPSGL